MGINIENAQASVEEDKIRILHIVEQSIGYAKLNQTVTALIRKWVMETLEAEVEERGLARNEGDDDGYGRLCFDLGRVMGENGEHDKALGYYGRSLEDCLKLYGPDHPNIAGLYNDIGLVHSDKGNHDDALLEHGKALKIR